MYASASPFSPRASQGFSNAYRRVGIETGVESASPHRLVAMLFDGAIESIAQARGAMQAGQIEAKGRAIGRAARIVDEGLKSNLNGAAGGALASDLGELYAYVTRRLMHANLHNDAAALDECQRLLEPLRQAWASIGP
ncbi:flagellar export chaperone FliS [Piscinibacter sp.]|uniref:flagellar export chaperone FliS n=1 Tax=Piscinibacter sp. TaxID=1903157 RepID=UPI002C83217B|nr:flagellar export chaperone FliS [Albitalea sp.]HUG22549.1 flagellar export chaperone FliS [Albitalea sp.]